jgi:glycosyltransferase involved in cell wall biosynthesis
MAKIKVLVVPSDRHGVGKYRSIDPHSYLQNKYGDDFHVDIEFEPPVEDKFFKNYQIVHFHSFLHKAEDMAISFNLTIERLKWCTANGVKTVVDIDDFWMPDQYHPLFHMVRERKDNEYKIKILREADWITTTTPLFADEIKKRLGLTNVLVIPNAINEEEEQFQPKPDKSDLVRFGWLGGSSHLHDLELLRDGISSAHYAFKDKIQFVLCGFDLRGKVTMIDENNQMTTRDIKPEETSWYMYEKYFTDDYRVLSEPYKNYLQQYVQDFFYEDKEMPYRRVWTRAINNYAENYNRFDVSLAPLKDTLFNTVKSQLKVIESGFHKKPLIASAFGPYMIDLKSAVEFGGKINASGNALLVDIKRNHKEWSAHIKRLMNSPAMREDLGNKLYETVKDKYSLRVVTKQRSDFYKSIV